MGWYWYTHNELDINPKRFNEISTPFTTPKLDNLNEKRPDDRQYFDMKRSQRIKDDGLVHVHTR